MIDKSNLIAIAKELRDRKDQAKQMVREGTINDVGSLNQVIIPRCLFDASKELQADQWYFNGFVIKLGEKLIIVDPGVDFYSRFSKTGLSIMDVECVIITHGHIDHTGSVDIIVEKLLRNKSKKIDLFVSQDAFEQKISRYYQEKLLEKEHISVVRLNDDNVNLKFETLGHKLEFVKLHHSVKDAFGFKIDIGTEKIGYVSDTGYAIKVKTNKGVFASQLAEGDFEEIIEKHEYIKYFFQDVGLTVLNMNDLQYNRHSKYHLSGWDVLDIFKNSKLKKLVLHHLSLINVDGEDSNYLNKLFFADQSYEICLPHYLGRTVEI